jgi:hypothetical protein
MAKGSTFVPRGENSGAMFWDNTAGTFTGALNIDGKTYDVTLQKRVNERTQNQYCEIAGTERGGEATLKGNVFPKDSTPGPSGKPRPSYQGDFRMTPGGAQRAVAAWDKQAQGSGQPFLSLLVSEYRPRQQAATRTNDQPAATA